MRSHSSHFFIALQVLLLGLTACSTGTALPAATLPSSATASPSSTPAPTSTNIPTITPTSDLYQQAHLVEKCLALLPSKPVDIASKGIVVLLKNQPDNYTTKMAFRLDLETSQLTEFSKPGYIYPYDSMAVSPNRETLAYEIIPLDWQSIKFILVNSKGEQQKEIIWQYTSPLGTVINGWINNQQLGINLFKIFNPYTGELQNFSPDNFTNYSVDEYGDDTFSYGPSMTRVIYVNPVHSITLADIETKQILTEIPYRYLGPHPQTAWSPNGSHVAVVGTLNLDKSTNPSPANQGDEIYIVDKDGQIISQVTHLSLAFRAESYDLRNLSWSTDGRYIAFWLEDFRLKPDADNPFVHGMNLLVLDTQTGEVTNYCTWTKSSVDMYGPIWSPNGHQILIESRNGDNPLLAVVVDIEKNAAFTIAEDMIPVGWMKNEP